MRCFVCDRREPRLHGDASSDQPPGYGRSDVHTILALLGGPERPLLGPSGEPLYDGGLVGPFRHMPADRPLPRVIASRADRPLSARAGRAWLARGIKGAWNATRADS